MEKHNKEQRYDNKLLKRKCDYFWTLKILFIIPINLNQQMNFSLY